MKWLNKVYNPCKFQINRHNSCFIINVNNQILSALSLFGCICLWHLRCFWTEDFPKYGIERLPSPPLGVILAIFAKLFAQQKRVFYDKNFWNGAIVNFAFEDLQDRNNIMFFAINKLKANQINLLIKKNVSYNFEIS